MVALDLHGFVLMAALIAGSVVFLAVALVHVVLALWRGRRAWRIAEAAALMAGLNLVCFCGVLVYRWQVFFLVGWNTLKWAVLLWLVLFVMGCRTLTRIR